jgi:hypothetical protein
VVKPLFHQNYFKEKTFSQNQLEIRTFAMRWHYKMIVSQILNKTNIKVYFYPTEVQVLGISEITLKRMLKM